MNTAGGKAIIDDEPETDGVVVPSLSVLELKQKMDARESLDA